MSDAFLQLLRARGAAGRPLIGGHRGAPASAPENTLASFRRAVLDGAEMVELDVHQTRDGDLAVLHDETTQRTTGVPGVVAAMTMVELRSLPSSTSAAPDPIEDTGIPSLGDVLTLLTATRERPIAVNVEIKGGAESASLVSALLDRHGMSGRAVVSSFDPAVVKTFAALRPDILTGLLLDRRSADYSGEALALGARVLHLHWPLIDDAVVAAARERGVGILAWTVNEQDTMRALAHRGVGAVLSDNPGLLRATLDAL